MPPEATPKTAPAKAPVATGPMLPLGQRVAARTAMAAGAFCVVVAVGLTVIHFRHKAVTYPLEHPQVVQMKEELVKNPLNDTLKQDIQALDLELRRAHDRYLTMSQRAQWLLLGGMVAFLASLQATVWRKKIARPGKVAKPAGWQAREILQSSTAVTVLGAGLAVGAWMLVTRTATGLSAQLAMAPTNTAPVAAAASGFQMPSTPYPAAEEWARNWGRFRGPFGSGVSAFTNAPFAFNVQSGEGVRWKVKAPGPDPNSPVLWEKRLFLATASARKREVVCYDADSGKVLWQKAVDNVPKGGAAVEVSEISGGFAPCTMAADGRRVYALFANGDLAAFDFGGTLAWAKSLGAPKNPYGHATSLALWQDRLIVQLDQGETEEKLSRLYALKTSDGNVAWETPRESHPTWATPIVYEAAGKTQILTLGNPHAIAYGFADGKELWRFEGIDGEIAPSPVFSAGMVIAVSPSGTLHAIKPDGNGDVTKTHAAWKAEDGIPDITSPVCDGQRVYLITTSGLLTCFDVKDGKKLWEKELELEFKASPAVAGDRLYLFSDKGPLIIARGAAQYQEVARIDFADEILASPAFADGRMYVRGKTNLFCIGAP